METCVLRQPENEVHILDGLPRGAFQKIVDATCDKQLIVYALGMHEAFVGIDDLFHVQGTCRVESKRRVGVEPIIEVVYAFLFRIGAYYNGREDTSREVAAVWQKFYLTIERRFKL